MANEKMIYNMSDSKKDYGKQQNREQDRLCWGEGRAPSLIQWHLGKN